MTEGLAEFTIHLLPSGQGQVEINGEDVSEAVSAFQLQSRVGSSPLLTLHMVGTNGDLTGSGIVRIQNDASPVRESLLTWLRTIRPERLEEEVLERADLGTSTMGAVLEILKEWADASDR